MERIPWAIPPRALAEWLRLAAVLEEAGPVRCGTGDAEAWWPDRSDVDELPARMALDACTGLPRTPALTRLTWCHTPKPLQAG